MIKRYAAIVGQSNEQGWGVINDWTPSFGCPLKDPIAPNGSTKKSMWPYLSELMGRRGTWLQVYNTGVGSTSIAKSWCGQIRNWNGTDPVVRGQYVLSAGGVWRCNRAAGTASVPTAAPTGTADTTGADSIPWVYLGVPQTKDVDGYVYQDGDARFDPNGYFAATLVGLNAAQGFDEKWAFISFGQTDRTCNTSRAGFAAALVKASTFFTSRGVRVALGFTCYNAESGAEAYFQSQLLPGWSDALATLSSNPLVKTGANVRNAVGVLAVNPATGAGLQADTLHMNDAALTLASEAWRDALVAAGW
jgi:hypothetical protein